MPDWWLIDRKKQDHLAFFQPLTREDIKISMLKRNGWSRGFDWNKELAKAGAHVFKLVHAATGVIQGCVSFRDAQGFVFVDLLETAPVNRTKKRPYINVVHLLFAFAAQRGVAIGGAGWLAMTPKSGLAMYYIKQYQALHTKGLDYAIAGSVTLPLIGLYYR